MSGKTLFQKRLCSICDAEIRISEPWHYGYYSVDGSIGQVPVHEACGWLKGIQSLVKALHTHLVAKQQAELRGSR